MKSMTFTECSFSRK